LPGLKRRQRYLKNSELSVKLAQLGYNKSMEESMDVLFNIETWSLMGAVGIKLLTFWWPVVLGMGLIAIHEWRTN
jgi:hypothetical protein